MLQQMTLPGLFPGPHFVCPGQRSQRSRPAALLLRSRRMPADPDARQAMVDLAYRNLAVAVFEQAITDSRRSGQLGQEAREWLKSGGLGWFEMMGLGVQPGVYRQWMADGCPIFEITGEDEDEPED